MKLRFSIRDLLWLTLVVALSVGWWLDRSRLIGQQRSILADVIMVNDLVKQQDRFVTDIEWRLRSTPDPHTYEERLAIAREGVKKLLKKIEELQANAE